MVILTTIGLAILGTCTDLSIRTFVIPFYKLLKDSADSDFNEKQFEEMQSHFNRLRNKQDKIALKKHLNDKGLSVYHGFRKTKTKTRHK